LLTVIVGPMFAGKSSRLFAHLRCAEIANQKTILLKPTTDTRALQLVSTHDGFTKPATEVDPAEALSPAALAKYDVIGIDEGQFLDGLWVDVIEDLADGGAEVIVACLNQDFRGNPFGIAPHLIAVADRIESLRAVCVDCGQKDTATRSYRTSDSEEQVEVGGSERYIALCRSCWVDRWAERQRDGEAAPRATQALSPV